MTGNPQVNPYFINGCMRCELGATPACKVHNRPEVLAALRTILLETELNEELKWSVPTYTYNGKNVSQLSALKEYTVVSFFKGALMSDPHHLLEKPGKNSQAARYLKFTDVDTVRQLASVIKAYVAEAIELEQSGKTVDFTAKHELDFPDELHQAFAADPVFESAFFALTPGRQRGYQLYFSAPKQPATRSTRIEKYKQKILSGKGFHDR